MFLACHRGSGANLSFPDPCKTPVGPTMVPVPYLNVALSTTSVGFSPNVRWSSSPALTVLSVQALTSGDEPGVAGGVKSGTIKGPGQTTAGSPIVFVNSVPAKHLLHPTTGNAGNAAGICCIPSVTKVLLSDRSASTPTAVGHELSRPGSVAATPLGDGCLLLRVSRFVASTSTLVHNAIAAVEPLAGLVIDLRGNPGGELAAALALAEDFVERGTVLARIQESDGDERVLRARRGVAYRMPLVVLVDGATASAAEVFAACLSDIGRAPMVGEPTFGKGTVQSVEAGFATVAAVRTPANRAIHGRPLMPDVQADEGVLLLVARRLLDACRRSPANEV